MCFIWPIFRRCLSCRTISPHPLHRAAARAGTTQPADAARSLPPPTTPSKHNSNVLNNYSWRHLQWEVAADVKVHYSRVSQIVKKVERWLAAGAAHRPTIAESGYAGSIDRMVGRVRTGGIVSGLVAIFAGEIERIVRDESFRSKLEPLGVVPTVLTGEAFAKFQLAELTKWGKAVQDSGAKVDQ